MLFSDEDTGIVIADGRSGLRLRRLGDANELGYPTLIELRAGPFYHADFARDRRANIDRFSLERLTAISPLWVGRGVFRRDTATSRSAGTLGPCHSLNGRKRARSTRKSELYRERMS
jgi:hypothetical protein